MRILIERTNGWKLEFASKSQRCQDSTQSTTSPHDRQSETAAKRGECNGDLEELDFAFGSHSGLGLTESAPPYTEKARSLRALSILESSDDLLVQLSRIHPQTGLVGITAAILTNSDICQELQATLISGTKPRSSSLTSASFELEQSLSGPGPDTDCQRLPVELSSCPDPQELAGSPTCFELEQPPVPYELDTGLEYTPVSTQPYTNQPHRSRCQRASDLLRKTLESLSCGRLSMDAVDDTVQPWTTDGRHANMTARSPVSPLNSGTYNSTVSSPSSSFQHGGPPFEHANMFGSQYTFSPTMSALETRRNSEAMVTSLPDCVQDPTQYFSYGPDGNPTNMPIGYSNPGYAQQSTLSLPESGEAFFSTVPEAGECAGTPYSPYGTGMPVPTMGQAYPAYNNAQSDLNSWMVPGARRNAGYSAAHYDMNQYNSMVRNHASVPVTFPPSATEEHAANTLNHVATNAPPNEAHGPRQQGQDDPESLPCEIPGCPMLFTGVYRRGNMRRHVKFGHSTLPNIICRFLGCGAGFRRSDARKKHETKQHNLSVPRASRKGATSQSPTNAKPMYYPQPNGGLQATASAPEDYNH